MDRSVKKKPRLKYEQPLRTLTPTYGRYCGRKYTGGKVDGHDTSLKGVDVFDEACRYHDIAYGQNPKGNNWQADYKLMGETLKHWYDGEYKKLTPAEQIYVGLIPSIFAYKGTQGLKRDLPRQTVNATRKVFILTGKLDDWALKQYDKATRKVFKLTGQINDYPMKQAKRRLGFPTN